MHAVGTAAIQGKTCLRVQPRFFQGRMYSSNKLKNSDAHSRKHVTDSIVEEL